MISLAISGFVLSSAYAAFKTQQKSYKTQGRISTIQQNLRGALSLMQKDIRMAGYDPAGCGNFGITDVGLDTDGNGTLTFTVDDNLNHSIEKTDADGQLDVKENFVYALYDYPASAPDGALDLGRTYAGKRQLISRHIEALGFAFAFDSSGDGDHSLDRDMMGNIIWAIDSDHDQDLDVNLDTDNDGDIDIHDHPSGKPLAHEDNGGLFDIELADIRMVRIWLLAAAEQDDPDGPCSRIYRVSNQIIRPDDGRQRRLMTADVRCRNMGLRPNH